MKSGLLVTLIFLLCVLTFPAGAQAPGDIDPLNANFIDRVFATASQPDGKTIITGDFISVLGVPRRYIARLNADGTLDLGFDPNPSGFVACVAVQGDGKVLLSGGFTVLQPNGAASPTTRNRIARVNADGTLDPSFDPKANFLVACLAVQVDGKVLLGGTFTTLQPNGAASPITRKYIARVHADGTLDTEFDPTLNNNSSSLAVQADGKVLVGGGFTTIQPHGAASPVPRQHIARLNGDGTLDMGFDPNPNQQVVSVALQADGKVLLSGLFQGFQPNGAALPTMRQYIARVNADGSLDNSLDLRPDGDALSMTVQADGKVVLGGIFQTFQPSGAGSPVSRQYIARINGDGTLDMAFDPKANRILYSVAAQADGKVLLGGQFTTLQPNGSAFPTTRNYFARLYNDPAAQILSAPNASQVLWQRSGASPEVSRVTFDLSTDGGTNWSPLGTGVRIGATANWRLTGLNLPATGALRARGATTGGFQNGASGLVEATIAFQPGQSIEAWRKSYFGAGATNTGNAADTADPDQDGLNNLDEYARNQHPLFATNSPTPVFNAPTFTFTRNIAASDISFRVEATDSLAAAWTPIATRPAGAAEWTSVPGVSAVENDAGVVTITDSIAPGAVPQRFLHVVVTRP